ncbi:MAG: hypothetical protein ACXWB0_08555 [Sulfuricurvum sp.]
MKKFFLILVATVGFAYASETGVHYDTTTKNDSVITYNDQPKDLNPIFKPYYPLDRK